MKKPFGTLPDGTQLWLYEISAGNIRAEFTQLGTTLVRLYVPDRNGITEDVVLGYPDAESYLSDWSNIGTTVGRNANRIKDGRFTLNGRQIQLAQNNKGNNLHSGPDFYAHRLWDVELLEKDRIVFRLDSPDGDQGYPGNATIKVSFRLEDSGALCIDYEAVSDQDTVFNLTNHCCFNLAGHQHPQRALDQVLQLQCNRFVACDERSIPTGELRDVTETPMDFRLPKPVGRDIHATYDALQLQGGYDHCYCVESEFCAQLSDPISGRTVRVYTDMPGVQLYSGNYIDIQGKDGVYYTDRAGICLETQFYPDAVNHPQWPQPIVKAGKIWRSTTRYCFTAE